MEEVGKSALAPGDVVELLLSDITTEGEGVGRTPEGLVVFVDDALPGDRVRARITRMHRGRAEASTMERLAAASERVEPDCPVQARCGGCPLMALEPSAALALKTRHLVETMRRVGGIEMPLSRTVVSPRQVRYRGRVRFAVFPLADAPNLGYRRRGAHDALVAVEDCHVAHERATPLARSLVARLARGAPQAATWPTHVTVRSSVHEGRHLLVMHGPPGRWPEAAQVARDILDAELDVAGVVRIVEREGRAIAEHVLAGEGFVIERLGGLDVPVRATAFLQVNPEAAELLYDEVRDAFRGREMRDVLDLYCGAGLASLLATDAPTGILGVEADPKAVEVANALAMGLGRAQVEFVRGDVRDVVRDLAREGALFDAVILNPPRAGAGSGFARAVARLEPQAVVLVSCHPATLARDARALVTAGFVPKRLTAVDLFPQTLHLEAVLLLESS